MKIAVAEAGRFVELALVFHFFGEKRHVGIGVVASDAGAAGGIQQAEIDLEEVYKLDQGSERWRIDEIIDRKSVAGFAKFAADVDDVSRGSNRFEDFDDGAFGRKEARSA